MSDVMILLTQCFYLSWLRGRYPMANKKNGMHHSYIESHSALSLI